MRYLISILRMQRQLTPVTLALGMISPAAAWEPHDASSVRTPPAAVAPATAGPNLAATVLSAQGSRLGHFGHPVALRVPSRPRLVTGKPNLLRNDSAVQTVETTPPAPAPAPASEATNPPAPAPQSEVPTPTNSQPADANQAPSGSPTTPAAEGSAQPAATPQVPPVQPTQPGTVAPAAGVELPW